MIKPAPYQHRFLSINYHDDTNRVLAKLLRAAGHVVYTARDLSEAEQTASTHPLDLVLCRMTASDGDPAEFIERAYKQYGVPSLAISGSIEGQSRAARLSSRAMRGVLWMPIDFRVLQLAIATALSPCRQRVGVCCDCEGRGTITLLTSSRQCRKCEGNGLEAPPSLQERVAT